MSIPTYGCVCRKKNEGGAVADVTVQTLSHQLSKTVFTKIKFLLSGLHFFMDGWFQLTVRHSSEKGILALVWTELATFQSENCPAGHPVSTTLYCVKSVFYPHSTSHTIINSSSPVALVSISPA